MAHNIPRTRRIFKQVRCLSPAILIIPAFHKHMPLILNSFSTKSTQPCQPRCLIPSASSNSQLVTTQSELDQTRHVYRVNVLLLSDVWCCCKHYSRHPFTVRR